MRAGLLSGAHRGGLPRRLVVALAFVAVQALSSPAFPSPLARSASLTSSSPPGLSPSPGGASSSGASTAGAGVAPLDEFLTGLHSLHAEFSQVVTAAHGRIVSQSTGEITVLRPGKFRWQIHPAGETGAGQLLVADGRNLWYYDSDLQQVTVRRESAALTATPAMLLSGGAGALSAFDVSGDGRRDGLEWVRVVPKAQDADFKEALLGFSGRELKRMVLEDKLAQTATLTFEHAERNVPVAASEVSFTPPAGADVIGKPQP